MKFSQATAGKGRSTNAIWGAAVTFVAMVAAMDGDRFARADTPPSSTEGAAIAFLVAEVPRWSQEHHCFSCHNNGDAARALFIAVTLQRNVPRQALADTLKFLERPAQWDHNGPDGPFNDRSLARVQFAAALAAAHEAKLISQPQALAEAAKRLVQDQQPDGSWTIEGTSPIGSPVAYGAPIATWLARRTLQKADAQRYASAIAKAESWFLQRQVHTVLDAAGALLTLERRSTPAADQVRHAALDVIQRGESKTGGWGPYVNSPAEPFDTAVVLLALTPHVSQAEIRSTIARGREYLAAMQDADGGWPATTRPAGGDSYAQRISTTGWVTQAMIVTSRMLSEAKSGK